MHFIQTIQIILLVQEIISGKYPRPMLISDLSKEQIIFTLIMLQGPNSLRIIPEGKKEIIGYTLNKIDVYTQSNCKGLHLQNIYSNLFSTHSNKANPVKL